MEWCKYWRIVPRSMRKVEVVFRTIPWATMSTISTSIRMLPPPPRMLANRDLSIARPKGCSRHHHRASTAAALRARVTAPYPRTARPLREEEALVGRPHRVFLAPTPGLPAAVPPPSQELQTGPLTRYKRTDRSLWTVPTLRSGRLIEDIFEDTAS